MSDTENIDDIIRGALEGHEFPFDEQNWEMARRLIDEDRKKKRRRAFFLLFLLPGFLLLGGGVWYVMTKPDTIASNTPAPGKHMAANKKTIAAQQVKYLKATAGNVLKDSFANAPGAKAITSDPAVNAEPVAISPESAVNAKPKFASVLVQNTNTANASRKFKKPRKQRKQPTVNEAINTPLVPVTKPVREQTTTEATSATVPPKDEKIIPDPIKTITADTTTVPNNTTLAAAEDSLAPPLKDSAVGAANVPKDSIVPEPPVKNRFTVLAGAAYLFAWEKADSKPGNGFNPVAGFSYSRALGKQFAISAGIQYLSVHNSNSKPMTVSSTRYQFGETKEVITIDPKKLHYIIVPLRLSYPAHAKNAFSVGCNVGYLFYSMVETQRYTETAFMRSAMQVTRSRGLFNGFNSFDMQLAIAWRRRIYKNFGVEAELFSGLSDIVNNNRFDAGAPQKNKGIKITLQYDLQKFKP